ncbi:hypothetical protein HY310_01605 [Candidatus Microgenomates bacterium]|nr:hypothetical protein [Candidatus Microgenomates bacterium]
MGKDVFQMFSSVNRIAIEKNFCAGESFKVLKFLPSNTPQLVIAFFANWDISHGADLDLCIDTDVTPEIDYNLLVDREYPNGTSLQIDLWCKNGFINMFRKKL